MHDHVIETERLSALFNKCGLGDICGDIEPVPGGLMHKMYKVSTGPETYAVKCLNPEVMKRPGVLDNYARAEELERILEKEGIPIVPAISFNGAKMLEGNGRYYYIFRWQEGSITDQNSISGQQCYTAGEILGRIHRIDPQNIEPEEAEISDMDFEAYSFEADKQNSSIAGLIADNLFLLKKAQEELNNAIDTIYKHNNKVLLNLSINATPEGLPMVSFTRLTPKTLLEKDRHKRLYKVYKPNVYISEKKMNPANKSTTQMGSSASRG